MGLFISMLRDYFPSEPCNILMLGLDGAGKTTVLYKLKLNEVVNSLPTIGFNVEQVQHQNIRFTVWDIGGQDKIRSLWHHYYSNAQGLVYVVDSNDEERIQESKNELHGALSADEMSNDVPVLIFANKQDLPHALSGDQLRKAFGLDQIQNKWYIQNCSAVSGEGIHEGLS
eukprot:Awhi_evm1s5852